MQFFSKLYPKANSMDKFGIIKKLSPIDTHRPDGIQFREVDELFRIIQDGDQRNIIVPYRCGKELLEKITKNRQMNDKISDRKLLRNLQRFTINIYTRDFSMLQKRSLLEEVLPDVFTLKTSAVCDECNSCNQLQSGTSLFGKKNGIGYCEKIGLLLPYVPMIGETPSQE